LSAARTRYTGFFSSPRAERKAGDKITVATSRDVRTRISSLRANRSAGLFLLQLRQDFLELALPGVLGPDGGESPWPLVGWAALCQELPLLPQASGRLLVGTRVDLIDKVIDDALVNPQGAFGMGIGHRLGDLLGPVVRFVVAPLSA